MIIKRLEDALTRKDWNLVKELYKAITGKDYDEETNKPFEIKKRGRPKKTKIVIPSKNDEINLIESSKQSNESLLEKFKIKPKEGANEHNKKYCKVLPFVAPKKNLFKDDRKSEVDSFDKKVRNKNNSTPIERRPPIEIIKAFCVDCNKEFDILQADMKINVDDGKSYYRCDSCWVSKKIT